MGTRNVVKAALALARFGAVQSHGRMTVLPLLRAGSEPPGVEYLTLGEALANWHIVITEVSPSGTVPEVLVVNRGDKPVLLLDGEELAGAKQNRALNTSLLLQELSETRIPVSGTEPGRWGYVAKCFAESGHMLHCKTRSRKTRSVNQSLAMGGQFAADQHVVRAEIEELFVKTGVHSPTLAMKDVFVAREKELRHCADTFPCQPGQAGLLVIVDGKPAGLDLVSSSAAYQRLHPKLVRSYALEATLGRQAARQGNLQDEIRVAQAFLQEIQAAQQQPFPCPGYGLYHGIEGEGVAGSALVHEGAVIHAAAFRVA